jgi:hypothetical protein
MIEKLATRGGEQIAAIAAKGRLAQEFLSRATRCDGCRTPKPISARGWASTSGARTFRVLCPGCRRRDRPLSSRTRALNEARWRRLDDAERALAGVTRRR